MPLPELKRTRGKNTRVGHAPSPLARGLGRKRLTMCDCDQITVRLLDGGRYFLCPYCTRVRQHPFFDPFYIMEGRAFCDYCGVWIKIDPTPPPTPKQTGDAAGTNRGTT